MTGQKVVYLHIGTPKTATTSLQSILANNDCGWRKRDLHYLAAGRYDGQDKHLLLHHLIAVSVRDDYKPKRKEQITQSVSNLDQEFAELCKAIQHEITSSDCSTVVLSCENFWKLGRIQTQRLCNIFDGYDVKVVVYLRRQDEFLESRITNLTLAVDIPSYRRLVLDPNSSYVKACEYDRRLEQWAAVFGHDNILVRRFEKHAMVNRSILDDFLHTVDFTANEDLPEIPRLNESLLRDGLEIKAVVNYLLYDAGEGNPLAPANLYIPHIREFFRFRQCLNYSIFNAEERVSIIEKYFSVNQRVANRYFQQLAGSLFATNQNESIADYNQYPGLSPKMFSDFLRYLADNAPGLHEKLAWSVCNRVSPEVLKDSTHAGRGWRKRIVDRYRAMRRGQ